MDVIINQNAVSVPDGLVTWGEVLDWLETEHLEAGQCITRVFLGDEEEIHYRNKAVCGKELESVGKVHIESGDFDTVIRESLAELQSELQKAAGSTREIISLLENRQEETAYTRLAQLLENIRAFYTIFCEDLGWVEPDAKTSRVETSAALENALAQLISAQENRFWVSICDVLEYEVVPVLETWLAVVEKTRVRVN